MTSPRTSISLLKGITSFFLRISLSLISAYVYVWNCKFSGSLAASHTTLPCPPGIHHHPKSGNSDISLLGSLLRSNKTGLCSLCLPPEVSRYALSPNCAQ